MNATFHGRTKTAFRIQVYDPENGKMQTNWMRALRQTWQAYLRLSRGLQVRKWSLGNLILFYIKKNFTILLRDYFQMV